MVLQSSTGSSISIVLLFMALQVIICYWSVLSCLNKTLLHRISTTVILCVILTIVITSLLFVSVIFNQTFAQESADIYEGLGIKIKYFDPWTVLTVSDDANCYKDFCMLNLGINNGKGMAQIWVTQDKENSPKIK